MTQQARTADGSAVGVGEWLERPATRASECWFRLRLPATSANLGPGFDALGLALTLTLTVDARRAERFSIAASGRNADLTGALEGNLILTTYESVLRQSGKASIPLEIVLANEVPLGMGCGSSAAALCAGVLLANHFGGLGWRLEAVLDEATRREGHPDNVAACLLGGMTVSKTAGDGDSGRTSALSLGADLGWRLLLAVPRAGLATSKARKLLPDTYDRQAAIRNVQSTALLVAAIALDRPEMLREATEDHLHQPYRLEACPLLKLLLPLAGEDGVWSVTLSGAGPAVLLIVGEKVQVETIRVAGGDLVAEVLELRIGAGTEVLLHG